MCAFHTVNYLLHFYLVMLPMAPSLDVREAFYKQVPVSTTGTDYIKVLG